MTGFLFASLLLPMFSRMLKLGESIKPLFKLSFLLIWSISIAVAANVWFFRNEISSLLYIDSTPYWGTVLGSLMLTYVAVSGIYISSTLITAEGQLKQMNGIFVDFKRVELYFIGDHGGVEILLFFRCYLAMEICWERRDCNIISHRMRNDSAPRIKNLEITAKISTFVKIVKLYAAEGTSLGRGSRPL